MTDLRAIRVLILYNWNKLKLNKFISLSIRWSYACVLLLNAISQYLIMLIENFFRWWISIFYFVIAISHFYVKSCNRQRHIKYSLQHVLWAAVEVLLVSITLFYMVFIYLCPSRHAVIVPSQMCFCAKCIVLMLYTNSIQNASIW